MKLKAFDSATRVVAQAEELYMVELRREKVRLHVFAQNGGFHISIPEVADIDVTVDKNMQVRFFRRKATVPF